MLVTKYKQLKGVLSPSYHQLINSPFHAFPHSCTNIYHKALKVSNDKTKRWHRTVVIKSMVFTVRQIWAKTILCN